ncbi:hypothetical protein HD597_005304 [Nonomuraea thailandensis]|uniref:Uncharacterized protein n=1 Tax=Nonomuraea thailandensis TaxID=1188745 RepID=A0A9X2K3E9_9ACTN|nr:hypothetical protein [Nonomuraea thailandensis]MCP2358284.1 hypothetical protein [Nonomuraea thailandensis]
MITWYAARLSAFGSGTGSTGLRNARVGTHTGCSAAGTAGTPAMSSTPS